MFYQLRSHSIDNFVCHTSIPDHMFFNLKFRFDWASLVLTGVCIFAGIK